MGTIHEEYQTLEQAVQKSQAQIRKHIKIEQKLKISLENLQQKSEEFQKKLQLEQQKYNALFQCMKQIEDKRKSLLKKVLSLEKGRIQKTQKKQRIKSNSYFSTINEQLHKDYFVVKKNKTNKGKHMIEKLNALKLSDKKSSSNLNINDKSIKINLYNNIVVSKKGSYDQYISKVPGESHKTSVIQLIKTFEMKQPSIIDLERRSKRKISKLKTQNGEYIQKKENRSNSVCK